MNYGLPYTGSKSRIAEWLVDKLPSCETFVDVFAGGCAVSDARMLHTKAKRFILNDLQGDVPKLFVDALKGDPPYKDSKVKYDGRGFDHSAFYNWCVETAKTHPVYITEYQIDDPRFVCIGEKARQISLNGVGSKGKKVERLYRVIGGMA